MKILNRWWLGAALALACFTGAHAQAAAEDPQTDQQLTRLLVDFRSAELMRLGVAQGSDRLNGTPMQGVFDQLNTMPDETIAQVIEPALRGHVTGADARKLGDFLETPSGLALINWMMQQVKDPQGAPKRPPAGDPKVMKAFVANGGLDALKGFSNYVKSPEFQRRAAIALLHYLTRPEANN